MEQLLTGISILIAVGGIFGVGFFTGRDSKAKVGTPSASHNTGSPKLADLLSDALELCHDGEFELGYKTINEVIGQLRAGA